MEFCVKQHKSVLACCDKELLEKTFEDKKACLKISKVFYDGETVGEKQLKKLFASAGNINIVGKNAVAVAKKLGLVHSVARVAGVPYALVFKL